MLYLIITTPSCLLLPSSCSGKTNAESEGFSHQCVAKPTPLLPTEPGSSLGNPHVSCPCSLQHVHICFLVLAQGQPTMTDLSSSLGFSETIYFDRRMTGQQRLHWEEMEGRFASRNPHQNIEYFYGTFQHWRSFSLTRPSCSTWLS
jgi:hypothetical protein